MITVYKYKKLDVAEISEDLHSDLMRYWDEDHDNCDCCNDIKLPVEGVDSYLCWIAKDDGWDAIQAMVTNKGIRFFGEFFKHKEYALRWLANEYYDSDELVEEDRKAGK